MSGSTDPLSVQEQLVNAGSSVPFLTVLGVQFTTFNEFIEGATLTVGFITGLISLAFQVRRYIRSRRRDAQAKNE